MLAPILSPCRPLKQKIVELIDSRVDFSVDEVCCMSNVIPCSISYFYFIFLFLLLMNHHCFVIKYGRLKIFQQKV